MGFYGKVTNSSKTQFSFDRIYSNRVAMDKSVNTDSVFVNRYVLIEYDQTPFTDRPIPNAMPLDYQYQAYYYENTENNIVRGLYTTSDGSIKYSPTKLGEIIWVQKDKNLIDHKEKIFVITSFTSPDRYEFDESYANTNYITNFNYDKEAYGPGRGYDSTVWQKTYNNGEYKYVMVAELNSVVPSFTVSQDAPTLSPITPHFDENSTNVLYNLHVQPQWGFRLKKATAPTLREINNITGEEMGNDLNYNTYFLPSDETMTWSKEEYDKKLHEMHQYYYDENGEWHKYLGSTPKLDNLQSAIYYYKDGFNSDIITDPEFQEDYIRLEATGKSGHVYNTHENNGNQITEDIQELSIMLPSIGKAVANMWDIIYGGKEIYDTNNSDPEDAPINAKVINITKEDFERIKGKGGYCIKKGDKWEHLWYETEYKPGATYGKIYNTYLVRDKYMEWEDGTTPIENIKLPGLRLINYNEEKENWTYNVSEVNTLAGSINSVHDLMGMIIVDEPSWNRNNWAEYINNSSDSRIYYTRFSDFRGKSVVYDDKNHELYPNRYYRRAKDIDFDPITVDENTKLNAYRKVDLEPYIQKNYYDRIYDNITKYYKLRKSIESNPIEGKTYYTTKEGTPKDYWNNRRINLIPWESGKYWSFLNNTYQLDNSNNYNGEDKFNRTNLIAMEEIYFPNRSSSSSHTQDTNYYLQLIDSATNKKYWFLVQNIEYDEEGENGKSLTVYMPLLKYNAGDLISNEDIGKRYDGKQKIENYLPGLNTLNDWLKALYLNKELSLNLLKDYTNKTWIFGGYFRMKLTEAGSGNTNISGIIRPENQYTMHPYEQVDLVNPYDVLKNNGNIDIENTSFFKVDNYNPANFVDLSALIAKMPGTNLFDYINRYPEIKSKYLYVEQSGQVTGVKDFLLQYFQNALSSSTLDGYTYEITETNTIIIKDAEGAEIPSSSISQSTNPELFNWYNQLILYIQNIEQLSENNYNDINSYWNSGFKDELLDPLKNMGYQLYFSIWDNHGYFSGDAYGNIEWNSNFGNLNNLDCSGYRANYYYVRRYKYIQFKNEENFISFKSNHNLYKVEVYSNTPLDIENKTLTDLPNILFYKMSEEGEAESSNSYYVLNNTNYLDPNKEYYTGKFTPILEDEEFSENNTYYYLNYIVSKQYNPNDLYYKAGNLTYINDLNNFDASQTQNNYNNLYIAFYDLYDKEANYLLASFKSATLPVRDTELGKDIESAFYEPYKYYRYNNGEYAIASSHRYESGTYFKNVIITNDPTSDFTGISSDKFYIANKYYQELTPGSGIYTLATNLTKSEGPYYIGENYYVISDDSGLYQPGSIWNIEIPVPKSVHLGTMRTNYIWQELPNFGKTLNTINGLILKMNQMLEWDNKLTRDTSTAQGCINMLNDIIGKFGAMRPADLLITDSRGRVIGSDYSMIQNDRLTNYGKINNYAEDSEERVHEFDSTYEKRLELNHIEDNDLLRDRKGRWISLEVKNYSLLNKYYTTEKEILDTLDSNNFVYSIVTDNGTNLGIIKTDVANAINGQEYNNLHNTSSFKQFYYKVSDLLTEYDYEDYRNKLRYKNADVENSPYVGDLYYYDDTTKEVSRERVFVAEDDPRYNPDKPVEEIYDKNKNYLLKVNLTTKDWEDNRLDSIDELKHRLVSVNSIVELKHEKYDLLDDWNLNTTTSSDKNKTFADAWENVGTGNSQNNNKDTVELYTPIVDDMGHIVGRNTETVTLPYGYKHINTVGQSTESSTDLFTTNYTNTDTSAANETKKPVADSSSHNSANNTQDILTINPGNKWIQLKVDDTNNSLTIAHEVHTVNRLTDSTDLNANGDPYSNSKDKLTVQDIEFDNAGHVVTNRKHTYTLPYSYKEFTTSQDIGTTSITQNTSTTTANNTQDKITFKMGNKWLNSRVDNDLITFAHETHWTSDNDNVSYPNNNNTNRTDVKTTTSSNLNGLEDFTIESYKFDNAGHVISHNTHTYELPHNYSFIDLIGTSGSVSFIDGTGTSGAPTVLSALEAKSRFSMYAGNRWITIKGTDTNGDKVNDSLTFSHAAAGTASITKGDSANRTLDYGSSFNTVRVGIDEAGHVSTLDQYSVKLPTQSIGGIGNVVTSATHSNNNLDFVHAQLKDLQLSNSTTATTIATAPAFNGSTANHTSILSTDTLQSALGKVPNMIQDSIRDVINASDTSLDTLKEIADWISQDPNNTALNNYKSLVELEKDIYGLNGNALKAYNGTLSLQDRTTSLETSKNNLYSMLGNVDGYNPNATYPDGTTKGTLENRVNWAETQINRYVTDDLKNKVDAAWDLLQTVQQTTGNIQNATDGYMKYHVGPTAPKDNNGNIITNAMWIDTSDPNNVLVKFPLISSVDSNGNPQGITWLAINTWQ